MKICFNARRAVGLTATAIFFLALALQVVSPRPVHAAFDDSTQSQHQHLKAGSLFSMMCGKQFNSDITTQLLTEWIGKEVAYVSRARGQSEEHS
jgi:hypothetical protein